ncbi:unnamed protein product [marine sediment metagenome]|uniref:Uncharacterized protein n=1 Tax=marine sediment metagenome TaxID=412755 RepID=X0T4Y4_9ZZZZ
MSLSDEVRVIAEKDGQASWPSEVPYVDYDDWANKIAILEAAVDAARAFIDCPIDDWKKQDKLHVELVAAINEVKV